MHLGIAILMGKNIEETTNPSTTASLFTFLEPLSFNVWIALVISYLAVGATLSILARFSPYEWFDIKQIDERDTSMDNHKNQFDLLNSLWFAIGSLMHQGADVIPRAASTRTVAVFWWMFTLIIISTYTAQFAAFLTVERMSTPIESAADLASQQKIKFGTLRNGSTMDFFRESKIPIYERMWSQMQGQSPAVFVNSSKEAITRVKAGNYAYMMESSMLEYYMKTECSLQTVGGLLDSKGYGVALPKGSPLRDILSKTVLQLQESTILEALKNKWWQGDKDPLICPQTADKHRSLQRVFGIFYVLFAGLIVSILMSMGEFCIESKQKSVRLDLTLLGKFFNWWHQRKFQNEQRLLPNRPQLKVTRLDALGRETDNVPRRKHAPVVMRTSAGEGHSYLLDEHRETPVDPNSISDINRRPSREEYRKLSRLIPQRDQNLINRRISTISR
uniref:Ionotropic glutamate receptor C-terminal domain-containing protein n=1 Tax=Panagrolaimus sp. ES5 TaxID=591445 RepID=A0AC34F2M7_9BILA